MADQVLRSSDPAEPAARKPGATPPPAAPPPVRPVVTAASLPPLPAPFVGRRAEIKALLAEIDRPGLGARANAPTPGCRVLLIAGRPGIGRTALAVHLARRVANRYPDGCLFARLTHGDGHRVPTERTARGLLRTLGAQTPAKAAAEELTATLRKTLAGHRAVLVLDDVVDAAQLLPLLPDEPGCLVVATSSGPLTGVADVRPCVLGGLDSVSAVELLTHAVGSTRIACDPRGAETLAAECASHPTALRLVGGWLATHPRMSVADAAVRMRGLAMGEEARGGKGRGTREGAQDRDRRDGPRNAVDRSPSAPLTYAFRLVHGYLPPAASRLLRLLVLAPAGVVDAQIASALAGCSVDAARRALKDLAGLGLLLPEAAEDEYRVPGCLDGPLRELLEDRERAGEIQLARARMLERTVRLLGACRIALETETETGAYVDGLDGGTVEEVPRELRFPSPEIAATWLRERLPALLAAARAAVDDGGLDNLARRLIAALVRALSLPSGAGAAGESTTELYELHGLVLDVARRRGRHREQAAALINLADLDIAAGRGPEALDRYRAALTAARAGDDTATAGRALESIGSTHRALGDLQRAVDWYGRALAARESRGEREDQARLHGHLGATLTRMGHWGEALRHWRAAATLHRRTGDIPAHARALTEVARALEHAGRPEDSLRTSREALRWARHLGDVRLEAALLLRMADTLERLGDPAGARVQREAAERLLAGQVEYRAKG